MPDPQRGGSWPRPGPGRLHSPCSRLRELGRPPSASEDEISHSTTSRTHRHRPRRGLGLSSTLRPVVAPRWRSRSRWPERIRSEAAWAHMCGTRPSPPTRSRPRPLPVTAAATAKQLGVAPHGLTRIPPSPDKSTSPAARRSRGNSRSCFTQTLVAARPSNTSAVGPLITRPGAVWSNTGWRISAAFLRSADPTPHLYRDRVPTKSVPTMLIPVLPAQPAKQPLDNPRSIWGRRWFVDICRAIGTPLGRASVKGTRSRRW